MKKKLTQAEQNKIDFIKSETVYIKHNLIRWLGVLEEIDKTEAKKLLTIIGKLETFAKR